MITVLGDERYEEKTKKGMNVCVCACVYDENERERDKYDVGIIHIYVCVS